MSEKVLSIQDISCYGQCSLTVALPILSHYGFETVILPSAVLSTHTQGFGQFTNLDLTEEMPKIISHWESQKIKVDAIYTGYIGDVRQFDYVLQCKKSLLNPNGILFVDPAMADDGKLYPALTEPIIEGMRKIVSVADYVIPNITEACFLTGIGYQEEQTDDFIKSLIDGLRKLGAKKVFLTGVKKGEKVGVVYSDGKITFSSYKPHINPNYHGTGDVFSSLILAGLLLNKDMQEILDNATTFVCEAIKETKKDPAHFYGVKFEKILSKNN